MVCRQFVKTVQWSLVDCVKFSALVNKCVRPSCTCSLGGSTYPQRKKNKQTKLGTRHIMYHFCSMRLGFVVSRYLLGTFRGLTLFSITNVVVLIWTRYIYGSGSPKVHKGIIGIIYLRGLASFSMVNVVVLWYESWIYIFVHVRFPFVRYRSICWFEKLSQILLTHSVF